MSTSHPPVADNAASASGNATPSATSEHTVAWSGDRIVAAIRGRGEARGLRGVSRKSV
jgi:hypothetical protein